MRRRGSSETIVESTTSDVEKDVTADVGIIVRDDAQIHPHQDANSSASGVVGDNKSNTTRRSDAFSGIFLKSRRDSAYESLFQEEGEASEDVADGDATEHTAEAHLNVETLKPVQVRNAGIVWLCYTFFATLNFIFVAMAVTDWSGALTDAGDDLINVTEIHDPATEFSKGFYEFFVAFHLVANTLAYAMLFFLLIAFPIAMIKLCVRKTVLVPEQVMVLSLIVILNVSPGTNLYSLFCTWIAALDFFESGRNFTSALLNLEENFYFRSLECLAADDASLDGYAEYHRILSVISIAFIGFFEAITCELAATGNEELPVDREPSRWKVFLHSCKGLHTGRSLCIVFPFMVYIAYSITVVILFDFIPSAIPVVQLVSVVKVCVQPDLCVPGSIGFKRALSQTGQAVLEFYLFFMLTGRVFRQARVRLAKLPYAQYRSKHLGFQLFQATTLVSFAVIFLYSLITVIISPFENWVCSSALPTCGQGVTNRTVLLVTGINSLDPAFLTAYLLVVNWIFFLAQGYLPAGSTWCLTREVTSSAFERSTAYALREPPQWRDGSLDNVPEVLNVFSIETEVLLFNFTNAVYLVNSENSEEANAECIPDGFDMRKYIVNSETDTHVLMCSREDRIILSFRGTVSAVNVRTDTDFKMVPYFDEETDKHAHGLFDQIKAALGRGKPLVHSGFLKAIQSVQAEMFTQLQQLLAERERPVMFTGHSLGGALAGLCAFSFKLNHPAKEGLHVSTFGCPKVGNRAFQTLYNSIVPSTFRIVNIRDIIPALQKFGRCCGPSFHHVGHEIALDYRRGNMVVEPNFIERMLLLRFRRYDKSSHFLSRYALSMMTWIAVAHETESFRPKWSLDVCQRVSKHCNRHVEGMEEKRRALVRAQILQPGVYYTGRDKTVYRDMDTQTENDAFYAGVDRFVCDKKAQLRRTNSAPQLHLSVW